MRDRGVQAIAAAASRRRRIDELRGAQPRSINLMLGFALGLIAVTAGCDAVLGGGLNPAFCAAHPADPECQRAFPDAGSDGPKLCMASSECEAPTAVCDLDGTRMCVPCTTSESGACTATTPVCIANQCQRCTAHTQCPASNVCLPDGACANPEDVAYVAPAPAGTDNDACTKQTPCTQVKKALATTRLVLKLSGTTDEAVSISDRDVTLLADMNTVLTSKLGGVVLEIRGSSKVAVYDLEIAGALGATGIGISLPAGTTASVELRRVKVTDNAGGGISAAGGTLTVAQSTIRGNQGGGISITSGAKVFTITDNFIVSNGLAIGVAASLNGGVVVTSNTAGSKLERNTIAFNQSSGQAFRGGVFCAATQVAAGGNLLYHNSEADEAGTGLKTDPSTQRNTTSGACQYGNTLAVDTAAGDLGFASVVPPTDFHLTAASPATVVDAGGACSGIDVDGDLRPHGLACDLGADEYVTQGP